MRTLRQERLRDLARRTPVHAGETGRSFSGRRPCARSLGTVGTRVCVTGTRSLETLRKAPGGGWEGFMSRGFRTACRGFRTACRGFAKGSPGVTLRFRLAQFRRDSRRRADMLADGAVRRHGEAGVRPAREIVRRYERLRELPEGGDGEPASRLRARPARLRGS
jgi:hypothetical protein